MRIQIAQSAGKLFKHSKKMLFDPTGIATFTELDLIYQTNGKKEWQSCYHYPSLGLGFRYLNLGEPESILGNGFGLIPYIDLPVKKYKNSSFRFQIGCGLSYLTKTYHIKELPQQTAIGSHLNNITNFQFRYQYNISESGSVSGGISLTHLSNGAFSAPNLGYNFVSAIICYSYALNKLQFQPDTSAYIVNCKNAAHSFVTSVAIESGLTLKEAKLPGGPKFLIQWYMLDLAYHYKKYSSWRISIEFEKNNLDAYFASYSETHENDKSAQSYAARINTYLGHQWLFGNLGLTFRTGYEFRKNNVPGSYPIATKLDLNYFMPFLICRYFTPYLGLSLKAHLDTAEYIGLMSGIRFQKID